MSFYQFTKNENKSIIWGLLHDGGVFKDLPNSHVDNVKKQFENTILSMKPEFDLFFDKNDEGDEGYEQKASEMITNSNKAVIRKMVEQISVLKVKRPVEVRQPPPAQIVAAVNLPVPPRFGGGGGGAMIAGTPTKKPKIEEIYRAGDLQKNRMSELEIRLKEKQSEMDNMLNNKKPENIDFTDKSVTDDKLSSNEMDRLLAEALSSRSRELDTLVPSQGDNSKMPESVASSVRIATSKRPQESVKKNVSFNDTENEQIVYSNDVNIGAEVNEYVVSTGYVYNIGDGDENMNENGLSFLSKLKKAPGDAPPQSSHTKYVYNTTPLDDIMAAGTMEDEEEGDDPKLEMRIFERRRTDETASAGESHKLNEKINIIQNELQDIKRIQDRILSILERKNNP
uniref:Uncharacterized protein n=1 Tax=viral metagenome TaxID=1070528 RepID=A0A6C0EXQ0_9ZZZZ